MGRLNRIFENLLTGELADHRKDEDYEPTNMVFDTYTKAVFYKFTEVVPVYSKNFPEQEAMDTKVGYMCPYLGPSARNCCFINNRIVEIQ